MVLISTTFYHVRSANTIKISFNVVVQAQTAVQLASLSQGGLFGNIPSRLWCAVGNVYLLTHTLRKAVEVSFSGVRPTLPLVTVVDPTDPTDPTDFSTQQRVLKHQQNL